MSNRVFVLFIVCLYVCLTILVQLLYLLQNRKVCLEHPKLNGEMTIQSAITEVAAMVGENVKFRRGFAMSASSHGVVSSYLHTSPQPGLLNGLSSGKINRYAMFLGRPFIFLLQSNTESMQLDGKYSHLFLHGYFFVSILFDSSMHSTKKCTH